MSVSEEQPEKHCWVCFATERDDHNAEWVSPCRCKGCTKWIHQSCLQRWLDEKQKGNSEETVNCPQCGTEYNVIFPSMGPLVYFLQQVDRALSRASPFASVGVVVGTVYWSAVTYGAVTVMQVVGHKKGLNVMERADPLFLLMGLPTIPVALVLGKMVRWEDYIMRLWHRYSYKRSFHAGGSHYLPRFPGEGPGQGDHLSVSRTLCGALIFPTVASLMGRLLFQRVQSDLQRTVLGGIAFILIKGVLKVYYKQQKYIVQAKRKILNYPDRNGEPHNNTGDEDTEDSGNE
ncbi:E3 ubiquitin-protein ligase MARCHF5 [Cynoglossus semilaevis]|uniref:E3 ubiquitin-protein ligase MARCHF5 n=1 Tax=Cynoglossus semilaevis TaxID=244447 RepID=A0A3P8ULT8_CYNSE|nr:E3 ubiquitin-protein ligase MARCH5-like [Cynoglossus semilaevis]XP_008322952.1 E3 ubiquitin-protein ligase MARCH5-like [Cynoglossus semilaevis]XP_024918147.1 E3 ubiquitin-protein ligase MARCH5-like [Cynoglossus semilaevis]XP_024918148.1 E3 ubiquitin-protein ligase MARCH5-like [Cynoglossus semilaevis]